MGKRSASHKKPLAVIFIIVIVIGLVLVVFRETLSDCIDNMRKSVYPTSYSEYVEKYSSEYGLDKYLIYAYIKTESGFNPKAVSETGARGLMQIMKETFEWIKFRLGDGDEVTYNDMYNPEVNIRYGTYLVSYLGEYFGDYETAAAAYFSGIGEVSSWLENKKYSNDGVHIKEYPSRSAAHYVNKINDALRIYNELYEQER